MPDAQGRLYSETLDLYLPLENGQLRLIDRQTGERLLTWQEARDAQGEAKSRAAKEATARRQAEIRAVKEATARRQAEIRAAKEATARGEAEEEIARLRAQLERLRQQID
jgi:hypothetical protein